MFESNDFFFIIVTHVVLLFEIEHSEQGVSQESLRLFSYRYICQNKLDRDSIIEDIFTVCFNREYIKYSGEYKVIKVNKVGRHQER